MMFHRLIFNTYFHLKLAIMKHIILLVFFFSAVTGFSQNALKPVTWSVSYVEKTATEGEIVFKAIIEKKWHIYSQRPTDVGPIPTSFTVTTDSNLELVGKTEEMEAHEEYVTAFEAKVFVFSGEAIFKQKVKRKNAKGFSVNTSLEFMTCNDVQCLPPSTQNFTVAVPDATVKK
ncbi:MAG: disulfide bond formation protein DsbD [Bacteroidetes bacterium]|jgi:thiol:disulfide interchange protein DsbD|nr:disulfide bond formation protein DsbD [Bacteroidota bacterium]MDF2453615.1 disulfide bond formation protein DsbD [Bacteroidota bacterium]